MVAEEAITARPTYRRPDPPKTGFTARFIDALRAPEAKRYELADPGARGLVLRVHATGVKAFYWYVKSLKPARTVVIGPWAMNPTPGHVTLREAREWLGKLKEGWRGGVQQLDAVQAQLHAQLAPALAAAEVAGATTVKTVADSFLKLLDRQRKRPDEPRRMIEKDILPVIGDLPLQALQKRHCRAVVDRVVARGSTVCAGHVLALLKQLLDYAENVEDDFINPAGKLKAANLGCESNVRDRWLTDVEIPLFLRALDAPPPGPEPTPYSVPERRRRSRSACCSSPPSERRSCAWRSGPRSTSKARRGRSPSRTRS